ncbi:MAG: hypothetical protein EBT20_13685 [Alphaproteobacteria bacterium]|nr:hypothetical protein [Alphaproteobacteria bacterium]
MGQILVNTYYHSPDDSVYIGRALLKLYPHISAQLPLSDNALSSFNAMRIYLEDQPSCDPIHQHVEQDVNEIIDGVYYQKWTVHDRTPEDVQDQLDVRAIGVRNARNEKLEKSDWTRLDDAVLMPEKKAEWATYRTQLRDITTHPNFPLLEDSDWPQEPA